MKSKSEILKALGAAGEEKLLLASLLDKEQACETRGYLTHTRFLSMGERALCAQALRLCGAERHALFWGGYADAERCLCLFYPDYLDEEGAKLSAPLALLRAHKHKEDTLAHRDYLGALMGLQIDRAVVGDILVHEQGADILVLEEMADFILLHFAGAGRKQLSLTREPLETLRFAPAQEQTGSGSVASPRLDSVIALVFGLSRRSAQERIEKGLVFVNHTPCLKPERLLEEGDKLTVRGLGRARISAFGGTSRKGRLFLEFVKNV